MKYIFSVVIVITLIGFILIKRDAGNNLDNLDLANKEGKESKILKDKYKDTTPIVSSSVIKKPTIAKTESKAIKPIKKEEKAITDDDKTTTLSQENKVVGYQAVYEYINENNLKAVYEEPKVLSDGTLVNVYTDEVQKEEDSFIPPLTPIFVSVMIKNEKFNTVLPGGAKKAFLTTIGKNGESEGIPFDPTEKPTDEKKTSDFTISAPPSIGQNN